MSKLKQMAATALEQAQEMLELAESDNWEALEKLQKAHSQHVNLLILEPLPETDQQAIREMLIEVQQLNNKTSALADVNRKKLVEEQNAINKASKMQKALDVFK